jgi:RNA polymerase sigma factor (sigma-70 family)
LARAYPVLDMTSDDERERLILEHLPQVRLIARRIQERLPENISLEDLISTGVLGLIAAIDNFDPAHNVKLKTYAEYKIRGAILDSAGSTGRHGKNGGRRSALRRPLPPPSRFSSALRRRMKLPSNWRFPSRSITNGWWKFAG